MVRPGREQMSFSATSTQLFSRLVPSYKYFRFVTEPGIIAIVHDVQRGRFTWIKPFLALQFCTSSMLLCTPQSFLGFGLPMNRSQPRLELVLLVGRPEEVPCTSSMPRWPLAEGCLHHFCKLLPEVLESL